MQTWASYSWKAFKEMTIGELGLARLGGDRALILKYTDECGGLLTHGIWSPLKGDTRCIALGVDWFLEIETDDQLFPENPELHNAGTRLFFNSHGFVWNFKPFHEVNEEVFVSLSGGEPETHLQQHSAPVRKWVIWESEKHCLATNTAPLLKADH